MMFKTTMNNYNKMSVDQYMEIVRKAQEDEKNRIKTGDNYELRILDNNNTEHVYLSGEDVEIEEGINWKPNGFKLYGNIGVLSGFYYGSSSCNDKIGTVLEIEYGFHTNTIEFEGKQKEISDFHSYNLIKQNKTLRLYKNSNLVDEIILDCNTNYVDGAIDKEIRLTDHLIKCISLRELYRYPSWIDPGNPIHRIIPYEISSVSFTI